MLSKGNMRGPDDHPNPNPTNYWLLDVCKCINVSFPRRGTALCSFPTVVWSLENAPHELNHLWIPHEPKCILDSSKGGTRPITAFDDNQAHDVAPCLTEIIEYCHSSSVVYNCILRELKGTDIVRSDIFRLG